ncbi:hypothetical protein [Mucilaginibacter sp. CSA2-8R]|uniref:hypothetical protein n=1 Tax=Mucilaginibacter sp. CSA2-8R TaxID=3141542 RepID=UPI00315DF8EB
MNMQDKDFDDLFRTKLGNLEAEPSARVWNNISAELHGSKKRKLSPVWSIAATTVLLLSAAAWFLTNKPIENQQNQVAANRKQVVIKNQPAENNIKTVTPDVMEQFAEATGNRRIVVNKIAHVERKNVRQLNNTAASGKQVLTQSVLVQENAPVINTINQPVLAAVVNQPENQAVVPDMNLNNQRLTATAENVIQPEFVKTSEAMIDRQPERKKKRGIHTLGGLINVVIAKVDKREDKIIEFTETDDDQANITGINLGLFKVKKEK